MSYSISSELYREVALRLTEAIGAEGYYSGSLLFRHGPAECRLTASVIVYRRRVVAPDGVSDPISRLVPVWWEFHTTVDGEELLNDFDFALLGEWL